MKLKKYIKVICYFLICSLFINYKVFAASNYNIPSTITINVEKNNLYEVNYENYTITSKKIKLADRDEVVYCLEIDKGYPANQIFKLDGDPTKEIDEILASGYPSKSPAELIVENEEEAYFATQVAIWSSLEGYDVNKIKGDNSNIINAIKQIYSGTNKSKSIKMTANKKYKCSNESTQQVVVIFEKSEEDIEQLQPEYPPQEG